MFPSSPSVSPIHLSEKIGTGLAGFYLLFFLYRSAKLFQAWLRTRSIVRGVYSVPFPAPVEAIIKQCQTAIGVTNVRVVCSPGVAVPITAGVFQPLIILPEQLLRESDTDLLASAVGHEMVHVARRDYVLNLLYELIFLPLAFHPAAALLRRRIKQTRELCCDEMIAKELLRPEVYARALVRLIGSEPLAGRLAADTTIGITDADILEVRIMSLLRRPKLSARRRTLLLIAASLLLITPCVAAASFALRFELNGQERVQVREVNEKLQKAREEWQRKEKELQEKLRRNPNLRGAELEAMRNLERELHEAATKVRVEEEAIRSQVTETKMREMQEVLAEIESTYPGDEARMREAKQKLAEMEKLYTKERMGGVQEAIAQLDRNRPGNEARLRELQEAMALMDKGRPETDKEMQEARERLTELQRHFENGVEGHGTYRVEPEYSEDARARNIEGTVLLAVTVDPNGLPQDIQVTKPLFPSLDANAVAALRQWRFQPYTKDGQPISKRITVEMHFSVNDWQQDKEKTKERYREAFKEREDWAKSQGKELELRRSKNMTDAGREDRSRRQVEMTQGASISMDRAIQIATSQFPGKVLACSLGRDREGPVFYHLVIITTEGDKSSTRYVWVSAVDGQILKNEKE
ncbi:MAG: TonB family protein [Pyrinomonadaceae bacterium]